MASVLIIMSDDDTHEKTDEFSVEHSGPDSGSASQYNWRGLGCIRE
jgi:hypothetical protein